MYVLFRPSKAPHYGKRYKDGRIGWVKRKETATKFQKTATAYKAKNKATFKGTIRVVGIKVPYYK